MLVALILDKMRPGIVLLSLVVLFMVAGIITPQQMVAGFSNRGMITVALLFLVSEGIRQSGAFRFRLGDIYEDADVLKQAAVCVDSHTDIWQSEAFQKKLPSKSEDGLFYLIDFTSI